MMLPLPANTASLKVRTRFAVLATDAELSAGEVESSVGSVRSGPAISVAAVRVPSRKAKYSTPVTLSRPVSRLSIEKIWVRSL